MRNNCAAYNKVAKMRLQQRYSSPATQTIGNNSSSNNNSSSSRNNKTNNQRAKKLSHNNNNNNTLANGNNKLRATKNDNNATMRTTLVVNTPFNNHPMSVEDLPVQEETTTEVELRTTASSHFRLFNTLRSSSTSAMLVDPGLSNMLCTRPRTLNVNNFWQTPPHTTEIFIRELLDVWRAKAHCNVVPEGRTQELFQEMSFHPSQAQIIEMLQTAKKVSRKSKGQNNGLTVGQFFVLAADLKRFRAPTISNALNFCEFNCTKTSSPLLQQVDDVSQEAINESSSNITTKLQPATKKSSTNSSSSSTSSSPSSSSSSTSNSTATSKNTHYNIKKPENYGTELRSTKSFSSVDDTKKKKNSINEPVEVFLGGSCNPTTWRADVAIPALKRYGISFYNPQVSDWTPDLIELEHRAKEKARVLFFVMDSETRASAGAIEAAHIAGQNCKQLVLVLHPYKPNQKILNEPLSQQEYLDLNRNQLILKELVSRRGLPVLDNIPSGLQRTKEILSGIRDPPSKISSILNTVRGAFDRVNPQSELLTVEQCKQALLFLGYAQSLVNIDNLTKIIINQRESLKLLQTHSTKAGEEQPVCEPAPTLPNHELIDFDLFCVISAYLSVLQQEIHESGCISPIKGTNVPPPQVYFTNAPDVDIYYSASKNISRTSSNASVPSNSSSGIGHDLERQNILEQLSRSRDSGTSSPQPQLEPLNKRLATNSTALSKKQQPQILLNVESIETTEIITTKTIETNVAGSGSAATATGTGIGTSTANIGEEEESDSNDSVFSSSSSIASAGDILSCISNGWDMRDVYLGGSCVMRTKWRQKFAGPFLQAKGISFHIPALHESIQQAYTQAQTQAQESSNSDNLQEQQQQRSYTRTRRKCRGNQLQLEEEEELTVTEDSLSWSLPSVAVRQSLYNPALLDSSRVLLFVITNETRSLAPMTLAAHCIGLMYNVVLAVQMLPDDCVLNGEKLTPAAIKDYNRGRSYLIDLAKRQGVPVFNDIQAALDCTVAKVQAINNRDRC